MKRALVAGAAVVLAAVIGLIVWLGRDDPGAAPSSPASTSATSASSAPPAAPASRPPAAGSSDPTITVTSGTGHAAADPAAPATEYTVGDVRIRDHRGSNEVPLDIPPNVHPPEGYRVASSLTGAIAERLKVVVAECTATIPPEARGASPRLEGQLVIAIKHEQATTTKSIMQLREVEGAAIEPVKKCIDDKTVGVVTPAPGEHDVDSYSISVSFAIL